MKSWSQERIDTLICLWESGIKCVDIAPRIGIGARSVSAAAKRCGLAARASSTWTEARKDRLTELWNAGTLSARQIALDLGNTSRTNVCAMARQLGLMERTSPRWTQETEGKLREMLAQGRSRGEIALRFGMTRNQIIGKCHRLGLYASADSAPTPAVLLERKLQRIAQQKRAYANWTPEQRERARQRQREWAARQKGAVTKPRVRPGTSTSSPAYRSQLPRAPEMTKTQLRQMMAQASAYTATLPVTA